MDIFPDDDCWYYESQEDPEDVTCWMCHQATLCIRDVIASSKLVYRIDESGYVLDIQERHLPEDYSQAYVVCESCNMVDEQREHYRIVQPDKVGGNPYIERLKRT